MVKNDAGGRRQDRFVIMLAAKFNGEGRIVDAGGCAFSSARYCGEVPKNCNTRLSRSEEQTPCAVVPYRHRESGKFVHGCWIPGA